MKSKNFKNLVCLNLFFSKNVENVIVFLGNVRINFYFLNGLKASFFCGGLKSNSSLSFRPSADSLTLREHKFFKKGQLQGRLKELILEQDPGHNIRKQDNILKSKVFYHKSLKTHCTCYPLQ